jgi:hypothetical protein
LADGNGDGQAEIIVVSTSGRIYGIGKPAAAAFAAHVDEAPVPTIVVAPANEFLSEQANLLPASFESNQRPTMNAILRRWTSSEETRKINEQLLTSAVGTAPAREAAFAELAVDHRGVAAVEREFLSASHWNSLPDDPFTSVSRFIL